MIEVWWGSGSPFAWTVLLGLQVKRLPWTGHLLSFSAGDTQTPAFLALNPRGKVPVVREGDFVLSESTAILAWLDQRQPEPSLFGRSAEEIARTWEAFSVLSSYVEPLGQRVYRPVFEGRLAEAADDARAAGVAWVAELARFVPTIEALGYLVRDEVGAADLRLYPYLQLVRRALARPSAAGLVPDPYDTLPALRGWAERIEAIEGFATTWPPHWGPR